MENKEFGSINNSQYKEAIAKYFDYSFDFAFLDIVARIIDRVEDFSDTEEIYDAMDSALIYDEDQWRVMMHYQRPNEADFGTACEYLQSDVEAICEHIAEASDED